MDKNHSTKALCICFDLNKNSNVKVNWSLKNTDHNSQNAFGTYKFLNVINGQEPELFVSLF